MDYKSSLSITIILISICLNAYTQDVHFSQRLAADRQRNPVFVNNYTGSWQAMLAYRQQWQSVGVPFNTNVLFLSKKFRSHIPALEYFGGIQLVNDKSGDAKLTANHIGINIGAKFSLPRDEFSFAMNHAFVLKSFDQDGLTFPIQYDRSIGRFNENIDSREQFRSNNINYYDFGAGISWKRKLNANWNLTSAFSSLHINEAQESFFDQNNQKNLAYGFQFLAENTMNSNISIYPYLSFYRTQGASEIMLGSSVKFGTSSMGKIQYIKPFSYVRTGADRNTDALVVGSYIGFPKIQFGASYDFNVSDLELATNFQGGFELSLLYTGIEEKLKKRRIACDRY